jgi:hypothetical protein
MKMERGGRGSCRWEGEEIRAPMTGRYGAGPYLEGQGVWGRTRTWKGVDGRAMSEGEDRGGGGAGRAGGPRRGGGGGAAGALRSSRDAKAWVVHRRWKGAVAEDLGASEDFGVGLWMR